MAAKLLVLSNGHGEDLIALRVLQALHGRQPGLKVAVLALVGEGSAFAAAEAEGWLQRVGPRQALPSGGFSNQSLGGLLRDLAAGLPLLSWRQWRLVRHWRRHGGAVLAVGDLLPLVLAWASGAPYGFIGTPKRDYPWRWGPGQAWPADAYHRLKGSEWDPWEWALMGRPRCRLVALRDPLTARGLARHGIAALAPGNPMLDGLVGAPLPASLQGSRRLVLLAGSRMPEARANFARLLDAVLAWTDGSWDDSPVVLLSPGGSRPAPQELAPMLRWREFEPVEQWGRGGLAAAGPAVAARPGPLYPLGELGRGRPGNGRHRHRTAGGSGDSGFVPTGAWSPVQAGFCPAPEPPAGRGRAGLPHGRCARGWLAAAPERPPTAPAAGGDRPAAHGPARRQRGPGRPCGGAAAGLGPGREPGMMGPSLPQRRPPWPPPPIVTTWRPAVAWPA